MANYTQAREVKTKVKDAMFPKSGVVGVGVGYKVSDGQATDEICVTVNVTRKKPKSQLRSDDAVPSAYMRSDGVLVKTDVVEIGYVKALTIYQDRTRPAPGGVSVGHENITAGTLGCYVVDPAGNKYILSNNHVLADSNYGRIGDNILQPGPIDGGTLADKIATLSDYIPIDFGDPDNGPEDPPDLPGSGCSIAQFVVRSMNLVARATGSHARMQAISTRATSNTVDAAVALVENEVDIDPNVLGFGRIAGVGEATLGESVFKTGRTTGTTEGVVTQVDATVSVEYGAGRVARFEDQVITTYMSAGGDSGSVILNSSDTFVGLLYAGSDQVTIFNRSQNVIDQLGVRPL